MPEFVTPVTHDETNIMVLTDFHTTSEEVDLPRKCWVTDAVND